jgi:anti-sigma B factor antagonist
MKITERKSGDVTVLDIEGKILLGEGDVQLKRKIDELVERNEIKVVLNLENVPYMDSGGLGEIVRSYTTATKRISDLLMITKLITVFEIFDDEPSAVSSFS